MRYFKLSSYVKSLAVVAACSVAGALALVSSGPAQAGETEVYTISVGGLLYDKWYKIVDGTVPKKTHPSYGDKGKKSGKGTWRCKECHGWDYKGKDGVYAKGSHYSGIKGIRGSAGKDPKAIAAIIRDKTHGYTKDHLTDKEVNALALFVSKGQYDMDKYIDSKTKAVKGDAEKGKPYYETMCSKCHGLDGKKVKDMKAVAYYSNKNPWEILHKIANGQPAEAMPAMRILDDQILLDILAYSMTLPKE